MSKAILNADNVLLFLLFHIKQLRAERNEPKIISADLEIWQTAVFALRERCNSVLLHVFDFRRWGLRTSSCNLKESFKSMFRIGAVIVVPTEYGQYMTADFILRESLDLLIQNLRVNSLTSYLPVYETNTQDNPELTTDYQAMFDETRELAIALLPMLEQRVEAKIKIFQKGAEKK